MGGGTHTHTHTICLFDYNIYFHIFINIFSNFQLLQKLLQRAKTPDRRVFWLFFAVLIRWLKNFFMCRRTFDFEVTLYNYASNVHREGNRNVYQILILNYRYVINKKGFFQNDKDKSTSVSGHRGITKVQSKRKRALFKPIKRGKHFHERVQQKSRGGQS